MGVGFVKQVGFKPGVKERGSVLLAMNIYKSEGPCLRLSRTF